MVTRVKCKHCGAWHEPGQKCPYCNNQKQTDLSKFVRN